MLTPELPEPAVSQVIFHETISVEIKFSDGREVVFTGRLAAELRETVQTAVRRAFARKMRGMSGPNSVAN